MTYFANTSVVTARTRLRSLTDVRFAARRSAIGPRKRPCRSSAAKSRPASAVWTRSTDSGVMTSIRPTKTRATAAGAGVTVSGSTAFTVCARHDVEHAGAFLEPVVLPGGHHRFRFAWIESRFSQQTHEVGPERRETRRPRGRSMRIVDPDRAADAVAQLARALLSKRITAGSGAVSRFVTWTAPSLPNAAEIGTGKLATPR